MFFFLYIMIINLYYVQKYAVSCWSEMDLNTIAPGRSEKKSSTTLAVFSCFKRLEDMQQRYKFDNPSSPSNTLLSSGTASNKQTHPRTQAMIWTSTSSPTLKAFLLFLLNQWMKSRFWLTNLNTRKIILPHLRILWLSKRFWAMLNSFSFPFPKKKKSFESKIYKLGTNLVLWDPVKRNKFQKNGRLKTNSVEPL